MHISFEILDARRVTWSQLSTQDPSTLVTTLQNVFSRATWCNSVSVSGWGGGNKIILFICLFLYVFMYLSIYLFAYLFLYLFTYLFLYLFICGPGSSVGIATELRVGRSGIESRWRRDFPPMQTGPGAHPACCKMGTGSFPGVKCGRGVLLTTHPPSSATVMEQYSYTSTDPLGHTGPVTGTLYLYHLFISRLTAVIAFSV
jgi:hypothetical protein